MSAHTQGPWRFFEDNNYGGTVELGSSGATVTVDRADRFTFDLVISRDGMCANGRLIAAAPDLLAAAHRALAEHEDAGCSCRGCSMLRAAIASAEGK